MSDKQKVNFNKYVPGQQSVVYGNYPEIYPDMIKAYHYHERLIEALENVKEGLESKLAGSEEFTYESMIAGIEETLKLLDT